MLDGTVLASATDPHRAIRSIAARTGFCDPHYRGELASVFDGRGRQIRYLRPSGVSLDRFGEILLDQRVTNRRLTPDEVWQLLSATFDSRGTEPPARKRPSVRAQRKAEQKARNNRSRKYVCPACGQIARGTRNTSLICGICEEMSGAIVRMVRTDPLPEEIAMEGQS